MALREEVILDIRAALAELDRLEQQLSQFRTPVVVPVDVQGEQAIADLRRQVDAAGGTVDIDVDTFGLESADRVFDELSGEIRTTQGELDEARVRADRLGDELDTLGRQGSGAFASLRSSLGPLVATFAAGIGVREVVQQLNAAVTAASELEQAVGGLDAVFGDAARPLQDFASTAAEAVGLSETAFLQLGARLGGQLQTFGFAADEAAIETERLIRLGADLAATYGGPVSDAVDAVSSLLRGETNPIERYAIAINQTAINARALALGLADTASEIDLTDKAAAALSLLTEQSANALGQFGREADTTAGRLERLRAGLANAQAEVGEALIPAFENLLDIVPGVISSIEDAAPAFGLLASSIGLVVEGVSPVVRLLGEAAGGIGQLASEISGIDAEPLAGLDDAIRGLLNPAGALAQVFFDIRDRITRGYTDAALEQFLLDVADAAEDASDPIRVVEQAIESFAASGDDFAPVLEDIAAAANLSDEDLRRFVDSLLLARGQLGLTAAQVGILRDILEGLGGGFSTSSALVGFASDAEDAAFALEQFRDAQAGAFSQIEADRVLRDTFGDLPIVVSDIDSLERALARAGVTLDDFLRGDTGDLEIIGVFDRAETQALELRAVLLELSLIDPVAGFIGAADIVSEETGKIITDLDELKANLLDQATAQAEFEANLAEIIRTIGPNVATLVAESGPDAALLAQALVGDPALGAEIEAILAGQLGPAGEVAAASLAETLAVATPQQLAAIGAFAADNFLSPAVVQQILATGGEIAQLLEQGLSGYTIAPELIIELTNAQISEVINTGTIPIGDGFGDTPGQPLPTGPGPGGAPPGANYIPITINNATTESIETSATQAAQVIGAVAESLVQVR